MIYIIDDKKVRQESNGWNKERFDSYPGLFHVIHAHNDIGVVSNLIESSGMDCHDMVFIHDSFFQNGDPSDGVNWSKFRNRLFDFAASHPGIILVLFSGGISSMTKKDNILSLPVSTFYKNLEYFIEPSNLPRRDLAYLMYGPEPERESELTRLFTEADDALGEPLSYHVGSKNLLFWSSQTKIYQPIPKGHCRDIDLMYLVEDEELSPKLDVWLGEDDYDNIFVPVSYGEFLSDFNGLRLAMHIRCTESRNRLKPIYIYSFVDHSKLLGHQYFDILKTKNVFLIRHLREDFKSSLERSDISLTIEELPKEIRKIHLDVPDDYDDSHRLTNEWAIVRWAKALDIKEASIDAINDRESRALYFKFLNTIHPIRIIKKPALKYKDNNLKIRVIHIDDDGHKGWDTVIARLINKCFPSWQYECISRQLGTLSREGIVGLVRDRMKELTDEIVIVLLDYRLHEEDVSETDPTNVTGVRVLDAIKNRRNGINPGIQVIIFSATEKISNYLEFKTLSDGFVGKESPWNSSRSLATNETIESMIKQLNHRSNNAYLKSIWELRHDIIGKIPSEIEKLKPFSSLDIEEKKRISGIPKLITDELGVMFEILDSPNSNKFNIAMIILNKVFESLNGIFYDNSVSRTQQVAKVRGGREISYYDPEIKGYFASYDSIKPPLVKGSSLTLDKVNSVSNKAINLHFQKTGEIDKKMYESIQTLTKKRNSYIHPNARVTKPLNHHDIENWTLILRNYVHGIFN